MRFLSQMSAFYASIAILIFFESRQCDAFQGLTSHLFIPRTITPVALKTELHDNLHSDDIFVQTTGEYAKKDIPSSPGQKKSGLFSFIHPRFVENFFSNVFKIFVEDPDTLDLAAKISSWITYMYILLSILGTIGFDTTPLLSLLSVSGLTVGFAAKDILTGTFKGFYILLTKPFNRGWRISVNGFTGKVLSIDIRYVKLLDVDNREILVPLSMVYGSAIVVQKKGDI